MTSIHLSNPRKEKTHTPVSLRKPLRCGFTVLLCSCLLFGAARCRAQETQDAAEAARQELTGKEPEKRPKHVYTEEDLGRAKILTPEDEARFAAQRHDLLAPLEAQRPPDNGAELAQLPLGDVARRYRNAKIATQGAAPFHLPYDEPAFAAPAVSIPRVAAPDPSFSPVRPSLAPRHQQGVAAPAVSNPEALHRVDPFTRRFAPAAAPSLTQVPNAPGPQRAVASAAPIIGNPQPRFAARRFAALTGRPSVAPTVAPPAKVEKASSPAHTVTVQPGDSLWKLAQQNLGKGSRWQELLAANPGIVDPTRVTAGTEIIVPVVPGPVTGLKADLKVTLQPGDSLSRLAQINYGRAGVWRCIARANPEISDVNRIYAGQQLLLPFACRP